MRHEAPTQSPPSARPAREPMLITHLRGTEEEMGRQHGELLRELGGWEPALEFYKILPQRMIFGRAQQPVRGVGNVVVSAMLRELQRNRPKVLRRRSRAFMKAVGMPGKTKRYLGVMDVLQNIVNLTGRWSLGPFHRDFAVRMPPACSTVVVWGDASADGNLLHGRNFDFPGIGVWDRAPEVVFCTPDEGLRYGFVTTRGADTPGVTGFNEAGIAVTLHTRFHRELSVSGAMVLDIGHDIVRRAETLDDAVRIVKERRVASTWGLAVSSARERKAIAIETNGAGVCVVQPEADHITVANRYHHPEMQDGQLAMTPCWAYHSDSREQRLQELVAQARERGGMTARDVQAALGDDALAQATTVQSIVIDADNETIWVSDGVCPASLGPWASITWSWDESVGAQTIQTPVERRTDTPAGYEHYIEATRIDAETHDDAAALAALERAIDEDPARGDYRFLAGILELRARHYEDAMAHFERGLAGETNEFRRGQLLLWASRTAAHLQRGERADELRAELDATTHHHLERHRGAARFEHHRPAKNKMRRPTPNMLLVDAV